MQALLQDLGNLYGIGVHGIAKPTAEQEPIANSIMQNGLKLPPSAKTILSTSISLGDNISSQQIVSKIESYKYGNSTQTNVVIAVPKVIENSKNEKIYLGFPQENYATSGQQYAEQCILDRIYCKQALLPKEFILGYYSKDNNGNEQFVENPEHFSKLPKDKQEEVFNSVKDNMDFFSEKLNDAVKAKDVATLEDMREFLNDKEMDATIIDNAIAICEARLSSRQKSISDLLENHNQLESTEKHQNNGNDTQNKNEFAIKKNKNSSTRKILINEL